MDTSSLTFEHGVMVGGGTIFALLFVLLVLRHWIRAVFSGGALPLATVLGIQLRGNPVNLLIDTHLALLKGGEILPFNALEATYMKHKSEIRNTKDLLRIVREQYANLINN